METKELCIRKTVVIKEERSIKEAARLMKQYNVGCLVVVKMENDHDIPVGMLTDRDIVLNAIADDRSLESTKVGSIMSSPAFTVAESLSLNETLEKMHTNGIRRVPIVNAYGHLVGILSLDDILDSISRKLTKSIVLQANHSAGNQVRQIHLQPEKRPT